MQSDLDDEKLVEILSNYLRDLYNDLIIRCIQPKAVKAQMLDKITFLEYTGLPGIIAERLFTMILYRQYMQPHQGHHDAGVSSP
jgi:hypothetical protein